MYNKKCPCQVTWCQVAVFLIIIITLYIHCHITDPTCYFRPLTNRSYVTQVSFLPVKPSADIKNSSTNFCQPHVPCMYPEEVDFRIIVMTFKRTNSLLMTLRSLDNIVLDGDSAALEIFIDRDKNGAVHAPTVKAAKNYTWGLGQKRVHVWSKHVGIYGQWIDTWRPRDASREISLILEDDMSVSRYCYRWLKAAHRAYNNRTDISGYTLHEMYNPVSKKLLVAPKQHTAFLYRVAGSWGLSPHPRTWSEFQNWYYNIRNNKTFHPYVPGVVMTSWYKGYEKAGKEDTMWSMWLLWFTDKHNLFCLVNNLAIHTGSSLVSLAINRKQPGLHTSGNGVNDISKLLTSWQDSFVHFPKDIIKIHYNGKPVR